MRPIVILLSILLFLWLIGMGLCHTRTCPHCITPAAVVPPATTEGISIDINDSELNFAANTNDNLLFSTGTCEYVTPLSADLQTVFENTVQHLQDNSNRILELTGLFESNEENGCTDAVDLGIARAEHVKALLVMKGAPEDRIEIAPSQERDLVDYKNLLVGGVDYLFKDGIVEEAPEVIEAALRTDKIILYFDTNAKEINLTAEQKAYMEKLKAYLAQNPDAKASVIGHTDDRGDDKWNIRLSRKRAQFVMEYMIDNQGIAGRQISHKGMGPDVPIASNATEEGRAENRRVEITLQ